MKFARMVRPFCARSQTLSSFLGASVSANGSLRRAKKRRRADRRWPALRPGEGRDEHTIFLSGEPPAQAEAARKLFESAANGEASLEVPSLIVAEAYYTLVSFYQVEKKLAAEKLAMLLKQHGVKLREETVVLATLERLRTANVGFSDAYLAAAAEQEELQVASFDSDFDKLRVARYEPQA
jgi:predicted nucleic acid-binding protein